MAHVEFFYDLSSPWTYLAFNNIQPVVRPDGKVVEGMLLFYGWEDKDRPEATAFLFHE